MGVAAFTILLAAIGDPSIAREQVKIGYALAREGRCEEAIPHFVESLRLDARAVAALNLADCEERLGRLGMAMSHWIEARTRAEAEGAGAIEEEATKRAAALEPRLARLTIALEPATPADAVVSRDGIVLGPPSIGVALPIDPGTHTITVGAAGRALAITRVTLGEGEVSRVEVGAGAAPDVPAAPRLPRPTPAPPGRSVHPLAFIGFGLGAAGLGVGAAAMAHEGETNGAVVAASTIGLAVVGLAVGVAGVLDGGRAAAVRVVSSR